MSEPSRVSVLFVCYANMCRSPLAEGLFRHLAAGRGLLDRVEIDSAGTSAIEGAEPHELSQAIAEEHGFSLSGRGRQLLRDDLSRFDHILVMDRENLATIERLAGSLDAYPARVRLLRALAEPKAKPKQLDIPDPIGRGRGRYAEAYELMLASCEALLDEIADKSS